MYLSWSQMREKWAVSGSGKTCIELEKVTLLIDRTLAEWLPQGWKGYSHRGIYLFSFTHWKIKI